MNYSYTNWIAGLHLENKCTDMEWCNGIGDRGMDDRKNEWIDGWTDKLIKLNWLDR